MVGMKKVKDDIFEMIIYYLQGFETKNKNMLHSVIEGPPGVGKTKLGKIIGGIYCALGIIPSNNFKYVKATDLIGDHVGATKHMTQTAIDEADGGVLFIDEAYALSSNDNKDPYGKECIDTLNFNLSENKRKLIVIIAGYSDHLDKYFFSFNPGLQRRFPFKFKIDKYSAHELKDIFVDKLRKCKWKLNKNITVEKLIDFFTTNKDEFPNFGGDIENLFKSCQFSHSRRMIDKNPKLRGILIMDDILSGLDKFKKNKRGDDKHKHLSMFA
jgi:ATPases of the AAA+ class